MDALTAHVVKHYRINAELGDCGLGRLFEATSPALGSAVTILVLAEWAGENEGFAGRFEEQMRRVQRLSHRALVPVVHFAHENGTFYLVMEHFAGRTLARALEEGDAPRLGEAVSVARRVAEGLDFAHRNGIVHGALHLSTIEVSEGWRARLFGLGIAKACDPLCLSLGVEWPPAGYLAPEQRAKVPLDARADVYALGAVLYRLLTGGAPAGNGDAAPARSANEAVPEALDEAVMRMLAPKPRERPQTARECGALLAGVSLSREAAEMALPAGEPEALAPAPQPRQPQPEDTPVQRGVSLYRARQWEAAAAHLEEAARNCPRGVRLLAYLGAARYAVGQYREAAEAFRQALSLRPGEARLHYDLGNALVGLGEIAEAQREFEAAWNLDPSYTAAALATAALAAAQGQE